MAKGNRTGKGQFAKGDKRINRDGRPPDSMSLSAMFRRVSHEVATKKDGSLVIGPDDKPMTIIEAIARSWAQDPKHQEAFVNRAFGPVTQTIAVDWRKEAENAGIDADAAYQRAVTALVAHIAESVRPDDGRGDAGSAADSETGK